MEGAVGILNALALNLAKTSKFTGGNLLPWSQLAPALANAADAVVKNTQSNDGKSSYGYEDGYIYMVDPTTKMITVSWHGADVLTVPYTVEGDSSTGLYKVDINYKFGFPDTVLTKITYLSDTKKVLGTGLKRYIKKTSLPSDWDMLATILANAAAAVFDYIKNHVDKVTYRLTLDKLTDNVTYRVDDKTVTISNDDGDILAVLPYTLNKDGIVEINYRYTFPNVYEVNTTYASLA